MIGLLLVAYFVDLASTNSVCLERAGLMPLATAMIEYLIIKVNKSLP